MRAERKRHLEISTKDFLKRFASESERGAVLSMVAYLDTKVTAFVKKMWIDDERIQELMLRPDSGSMGSLGAKIGLCYLSGWLTNRTYKDLSTIIQIRNLFAHQLDVTNFNHSMIDSHCRKLLIFEDANAFFGGGEDALYQIQFYKDAGYNLSHHRWGFVAAVGYLGNCFQGNHNHPLNLRVNAIRPLF